MAQDIGLIGLAVMGQNLALNMADHGFAVAVYNRSFSKTQEFLAGPAQGKNLVGFEQLSDFVQSLSSPRKIILMVKAGDVVDAFIDQLKPLLSPGDVIIDGGNSNYEDTIARTKTLTEEGLLFVGSGISGGEEGARFGPSLMPGGNPLAWPLIQDIWQAIAAKADGEPCCAWVGNDGAGHYVKMVHNGIEYGDMQLIAEAYQLLRFGLGLSVDHIQEIFAQWNEGVLDSYLIEITANILKFKDEDGAPLVDKILDKAGQKGTGKWTGISALNEGIPVTLIVEAVFARSLSALKDERQAAEAFWGRPELSPHAVDPQRMINAIHDALYASKIISYTQGYMLLQQAAKTYGWDLHYGDIALMWRGGCIIRSVLLGKIKAAFDAQPQLNNLLMDAFFKGEILRTQAQWREALVFAIQNGIATPAMSSALAFFDGYRSGQSPANLLQAQRDYFGAHTYERTDKPRGEFFHTDWVGLGGVTSSSTYNA